ncbi:MAG: hypothetical protein NC177_08220 [Ruminococcus flavefaciens]|nr:hypothetical protein [Ruminococcus flavefaciens]
MNEDFFDKGQQEDSEKMPESLKTGLATASFVISLVNLVFCAFACSFVTAPVSIIMGAIALARHQGGKAFAVIGIIISSVSLIICILFTALFAKIYPDMEYFIRNDTAIISEFEEDGTIPEQFEKYRSPKYDKYWQAFQCKDFDEFFEIFIDIYRQSDNVYSIPDSPYNPDNPTSPDDDEELVVLGYNGAISGMKFLKTA